MAHQPRQHESNGDFTPSDDRKKCNSCARQYGPMLLLLVLVSATVVDVPPVGNRSVRAEGTADRAELDARLQQAVTQSLIEYEQVKIAGLSVEVESGIVTLEGRVATPAEKHLAARKARDVTGVRGVVNALDVDAALQLVQ